MSRCNFTELRHPRCSRDSENKRKFCSIHIGSCQYVHMRGRYVTCPEKAIHGKYCPLHDDTCLYMFPNGNKCTNYSGRERRCSQHDTKEHC